MTRQEFTQYGIEALRLFLRQPVPGFLDEIRAGEGGACQSHGLQRARALIGAQSLRPAMKQAGTSMRWPLKARNSATAAASKMLRYQLRAP